MRILIALACLLPAAALADLPHQPTFRWEGPTEWVSGAPLDPAVDLKEFRLYCDGEASTAEVLPNVGDTWTAPVGFFTPGLHTCYMTAVANDDSESAPSNTKTFTVDPDRPGPLVIFEVQ